MSAERAKYLLPFVEAEAAGRKVEFRVEGGDWRLRFFGDSWDGARTEYRIVPNWRTTWWRGYALNAVGDITNLASGDVWEEVEEATVQYAKQRDLRVIGYVRYDQDVDAPAVDRSVFIPVEA